MIINFFWSMFKGKEMKERNPYNAATLEWTTPVKGIHGNWPGKIPTVHRWAYDYGKFGEEAIPQYVPVSEAEHEAEKKLAH